MAKSFRNRANKANAPKPSHEEWMQAAAIVGEMMFHIGRGLGVADMAASNKVSPETMEDYMLNRVVPGSWDRVPQGSCNRIYGGFLESTANALARNDVHLDQWKRPPAKLRRNVLRCCVYMGYKSRASGRSVSYSTLYRAMKAARRFCPDAEKAGGGPTCAF